MRHVEGRLTSGPLTRAISRGYLMLEERVGLLETALRASSAALLLAHGKTTKTGSGPGRIVIPRHPETHERLSSKQVRRQAYAVWQVSEGLLETPWVEADVSPLRGERGDSFLSASPDGEWLELSTKGWPEKRRVPKGVGRYQIFGKRGLEEAQEWCLEASSEDSTDVLSRITAATTLDAYRDFVFYDAFADTVVATYRAVGIPCFGPAEVKS